MTSLSYIFPHRNRTELFRHNLDSLRSQTDPDFDVIVIDNSDDRKEVKSLVAEYRHHGLRMKVFFVEPWRNKFAHSKEAYGGNYNPALSQNIGAKHSNSDLIVLTSPEVINAKTNVENWKQGFADGNSRFILGWIGERPASAMPDLWKGISVEQVKVLCAVPGGDQTRCRENSWSPENYFLGALKRADFIRIGGMDERYLAGMAFEDNCFSERCSKNGIVPEFCGKIAGIHLAHSRAYQGAAFSPENPNFIIYSKNKSDKIANQLCEWGSDECVIEEY